MKSDRPPRSNDEKTPESMTDVDAPLSDPNQDALGRQTYAQRVAQIIAASHAEHSAVFAIYGEWGSGKTSFKNFVLAHLQQLPEDQQPLVIEFNPWEWEGPRQVAEAFFARIAEELHETAPNGAEVSERLGRYASYFTLGASIANSAGTVLPLLLPVLGPIATLTGKSLGEAATQAKNASQAPPKRQSLSELRKELIESIRKMNRTVLVTIDDVDRLTTAETAILFQLLKSNADFPNVTYLLLCDREVVARNLREVVAGHGEEYLEKIVQLGLPLPKAYPEQLRGELLSGLFAQFANAGVAELVDRNRLTNLYDEHGEAFFRTMRDVKRFLASVSSLLPAVVRNGTIEVDLIDFVGLEMLRMFDSDLYEAIYCYRTRVTGREGAPSTDKEFLQRLAGDRGLESASIGIFRELFPRFAQSRSLSRDSLAIAHPRAFDHYFLFATPPDQYSPAEAENVLARRGHPEFAAELESAHDRGRLQHLLELLDRAEPVQTFESAVNYLAALGSFADTLHLGDGAEDVESYRAQVERLGYSCLRPYDVADRTELLIRGCEQSDSLWFPVSFESFFVSNEKDKITEAGRHRLREIAATRLASAGHRLRLHPSLGELLLWWLKNGDPERAMAYAKDLLNDQTTLLNLVYTLSRPGITKTLKPRNRTDGFRTFARELGRLVPIEKVLARMDALPTAELTWNERELIRSVREDARRMAATDVEIADGGDGADTEDSES